jgi:hypothetical protein
MIKNNPDLLIIDDLEENMETQRTIIKHHRGWPRNITIAGVVNYPTATTGGTFRFGYAIQNPKDKNFNKKLGVLIAEGRAFKKPFYVWDLNDDPMVMMEEAFATVVEHIRIKKYVPYQPWIKLSKEDNK